MLSLIEITKVSAMVLEHSCIGRTWVIKSAWKSNLREMQKI